MQIQEDTTTISNDNQLSKNSQLQNHYDLRDKGCDSRLVIQHKHVFFLLNYFKIPPESYGISSKETTPESLWHELYTHYQKFIDGGFKQKAKFYGRDDRGS